MRYATFLLLLAALSTAVSAWGPGTHAMLCGDVVSEAWGSGGVQCLSSVGEDYCLLVKEVGGEDAYSKCAGAVGSGGLSLLSLTDGFYGDAEYHTDYTRCPIWDWNPHKAWICKSEYEPSNLSQERAGEWFGKAAVARSDCLRVQAFCTGALYYSDGFYPLNQVNPEYLKGCSGMSLAEEVDSAVKAGSAAWNVSKFCSFTHWKERAGRKVREDTKIVFKVDEGVIEAVKGGLVREALGVRGGVSVVESSSTTTTAAAYATTTGSTSTTQIKLDADAEELDADVEELLEELFGEDVEETPGESMEIPKPPPMEVIPSEAPVEPGGENVGGNESEGGVVYEESDAELQGLLNVASQIGDYLESTSIGRSEARSGKAALKYFIILVVAASLGFMFYVAKHRASRKKRQA